MALKYSTKLRNAQMDMVLAVLKNLTITSSAITGTATAPVLEIRDGAVPASCAAADTGNLLASMALATTAFNASSSGTITKNGTWQDGSADTTGNATYFRIKDSTGTCHLQGTVGLTAPADLLLDTTSIVSSQVVTINSFSLTAGNA